VKRRARWLALALAALAGLIVVAVLIGPRLGGTSGLHSPLPSASTPATAHGSLSPSASALAAPGCAQSLLPRQSSSPAPSEDPGTASLVLRLWKEGPRRFHALTVLEDGRIITTSYPPGAEDPQQGTSVERRLTAAGTQLLRDDLDATGLTFLTSSDWLPVDQPWDGLPSSLEVGLPDGETSVVSWLLMCSNPETEALDALADRLLTLDEWLPSDAWADANGKPYVGPAL
jgi:hypothetical protein